MRALRPRTRAGADLLRLVALWLVAALLLQGLLAAQARGSGPLHRHRGDMVATAFRLPAVLQHRVAADRHDDSPRGGRLGLHGHDHGAERHLHGAGDISVLPAEDGESPFDAAAFALAAALALARTHALALGDDSGRHVWRAARAWAWRVALTVPPRRPPRGA